MRFVPALRLIGILLFAVIIWRLDRVAIAGYVQAADTVPLLTGLAALFGVFAIKAIRWHLLAEAAGARRDLGSSWREFMIGVFLSTFTPAKLGDFGKVAYLKRDGIAPKTAALLVVAERIADMVVLAVIGVGAIGILWGGPAALLGLLTLGIGTAAMIGLAHAGEKSKAALRYCVQHHAVPGILLTTAIGWALHYVWAVGFAWGLHMTVPVPILIAALTGASLLNALPIAPSGLGTREAALLALLTPYGADPEQTVALSLLMFGALLIGALPGAAYCLFPRKQRATLTP